MGSGPGQAMLLLFPALFSCALAIRPMPLQSLDKYAPKGLYDSLSTDVSPARDDFTRSRTHTGSQQDNHFHDKPWRAAPRPTDKAVKSILESEYGVPDH